MYRRIAPLALALCLSLPAKGPLQPVQVVTTDQVDFAAGGTIRFEGSYGELNIEGWDQPQVQVVLTRLDYAGATDKDRGDVKRQLERIAVKMEKRSGNELVVTTQLPHRNYAIRKFRGASDSDMDYRIMAPRNSHLIIHHGNGDVLLYDVGGDIEVTAGVGSIMVQLQDPAEYAVDAHSRLGEVYTDYSGGYRTHAALGHSFVSPAQPAAHKVFLRLTIGPIDVVKMGVNPIAK